MTAGPPSASAWLRRLLGEWRRNPELESVEVLELEHPCAPRTIGRFIQQRAAFGPDPCRRRVDIRGARHVDLQVEALTLDAVPAELAIVLVENDAAVAGRDDRPGNLAFILEGLSHRETDGIAVEAN